MQFLGRLTFRSFVTSNSASAYFPDLCTFKDVSASAVPSLCHTPGARLPLMLSPHARFPLLHPHMLFVGVSRCQSLLPQLLFANRSLLFLSLLLFALFVDIHGVCLLCLFFCVSFRIPGMSTRSSDSSDSRLPIIRRGEGSMEETYDESYADDREYQEDNHSLSSDMYCLCAPDKMVISIFKTDSDGILF